MQILVVIAILVVIGTGFISRNRTHDKNPQTLGENTVQVDIATPIPTIMPTDTPIPTSTPTPKAIINTPTNTPKAQNQTSTLVYPGARFISTNKYESTDNVDKITEWYKDQIRNMGYNTKSFVTTSTNGEILNKLSAAKSGSNVLVEISKSASVSEVQITLVPDK